MESLERLHRQLDSLDQLRTIVRTMKALSATSIHQYEQSVRALAGYYRTVERGLHVVIKDMAPAVVPDRRSRAPQRLAAIVFGSDHGLCGRFNEQITDYALERLDATATEPGDRKVLAVGARVGAALEQRGQAVETEYPLPGSAVQITASVQRILLQVDRWRSVAGVHPVYLFYNRHSRGRAYGPAGFELLPIDPRRFHHLEEKTWPSRSLPVYTMPREKLLSRLLHQYLFVSVFRACAESQASEHAGRLAAMQSAEYNLNERLDEVTTSYRRARQSVITAELLDVVGGFEAITRGGH